MAAYPSFGQMMASSENREDRVLLDRASNGALYGRALWTSAKRRFQVEHELSDADAATLRSFYATNRALAVDFTWAGDSTVYSCLFAEPPTLQPQGGGWWRARVTLVEA